MATEFSLIDKYFKPLGEATASPNVVLGIGDDCAILNAKPGCQLAISSDTLVSGVHFLKGADPFDVGYKSLAVNLSDLAAMGAEPAWFSLCVTLPNQDEAWLKRFAEGLTHIANVHSIPLVGGDTTQGPLAISIHIAGWVPHEKAVTRNGAKPGDQIYVAGELGWPFLGLDQLQSISPLAISQADAKKAISQLLRPVPQLQLGDLLQEVASAMLDISDGLTADLNHILNASGVGASLAIKSLPVAQGLKAFSQEIQWQALNFGDEYKLLFTVPGEQQARLQQIEVDTGIQLYRIGEITESALLLDEQGNELTVEGYQHFNHE